MTASGKHSAASAPFWDRPACAAVLFTPVWPTANSAFCALPLPGRRCSPPLFQGLGLANCIILHPTLCCLGVSALDANDIFKMFITNGIVHHVTVGLGHHAAFTFAGVQEPPIPPDRLLTANIHDGSALILSEKGSKFISLLFFEA